MSKNKKIYFGFLILIAIISTFLYTSYAIFTSNKEYNGKLNMVAGSLDYKITGNNIDNNEITLKKKTDKIVDLTITSLNNINSNYELYYEIKPSSSSNITVGYSENSDPTKGEIEAKGTKNIKLILSNNSDSDVVISLGVEGGFTHNTLVLTKGNSLNQAQTIVGKTYTYEYSGSEEEFIAPTDGYYKIEAWGASGEKNEGVLENSNGLGGYTSGVIELKQNTKLYINVGGSSSAYNSYTVSESSGGGATDIRIKSSKSIGLYNLSSLTSRIMVAAGGGGGMVHATLVEAGDAGGLVGYDAKATYPIEHYGHIDGFSGYGATQTSGGKTGEYGVHQYYELMDGAFGQGGYGYGTSSGGGGGWYGGGHGRHPGGSWSGGGGGSSYISGHLGCIGVLREGSTTPSDTSNSYTGYIFTDTSMIDGRGYKWTYRKESYTGMPDPNGDGVITGNTGDGHVKITYLGTSRYQATNLVSNGSFENGISEWDNYDTNYLDVSTSSLSKYGDNSLKVYFKQDTSSWVRRNFLEYDNVVGHKFYVKISTYRTSLNNAPALCLDYLMDPITQVSNHQQTAWYGWYDDSYNKWVDVSLYSDSALTDYLKIMLVQTQVDGSSGTNIYYDGLVLVDLTEAFGQGNEPDKEWCDNNIEYFDGTSYIYK